MAIVLILPFFLKKFTPSAISAMRELAIAGLCAGKALKVLRISLRWAFFTALP
jgi:hypothetical protein